MNSIIGNELMKTFTRWRSYIGFIAVGAVVPLVEIALKLEGGSMIKMMTRELAADFLFIGNLFNAYFVTYFIMNSLWLHIPFLISLAAGDMLAGEATGGTFRLLLTRPPSRTRILFAKYITALTYTAALVVFLGILSIGLGLALFGTGDLLVPGRGIVVIAKAEAPWRLAAAFGLSVWSMWCVTSLAFMFSSLVENALGPVIGSMAVIIVLLIISTIPVSLFTAVRPWLFTTYFSVWQQVMEVPVDRTKIAMSAAVLGAYTLAFLGISWYVFVRKDILS